VVRSDFNRSGRYGGEIANQLPQLASMFMLGRGRGVSPQMGQAQMLSLALGSLRTGSTPATALRGLTYLLQSIAQPTGGASKSLAGVGITPRMVEQQGIYAALMKLLHQITTPSRGAMNQIVGMNDDTLNQLDEQGGNLPGISATEMVRLRKMIPRIHGIRAAVILASQLDQQGGVSSLAQDLKLMNDAQNDQIDGALQMSKAWQRFRNRAKLQEATVAINAMAIQVATVFEPVLNFVASRVTGLQGLMADHPHATRAVALGGAAFMAALGVGRFAGVGRLPGINKIPGLRGLLGGGPGRAFVMAQAATAAFSGNAQLGASPQNPLYVIMVGEIFGGGTKSPTGRGGGGGGGVENAVEGYVGFKAARGVFRRGRGLAGRLFGRGAGEIKYDTSWMTERGGLRLLPRLGSRAVGGPLAAAIDFFGNPDQLTAAQTEGRYFAEVQQLQRRFGRSVHGFTNAQQGTFRGRAEIFLTIDQRDANGKVTRRRVHVPVDMWAGGRVPTARGQAANRRG
jgi:hypothetical protein